MLTYDIVIIGNDPIAKSVTNHLSEGKLDVLLVSPIVCRTNDTLANKVQHLLENHISKSEKVKVETSDLNRVIKQNDNKLFKVETKNGSYLAKSFFISNSNEDTEKVLGTIKSGFNLELDEMGKVKNDSEANTNQENLFVWESSEAEDAKTIFEQLFYGTKIAGSVLKKFNLG